MSQIISLNLHSDASEIRSYLKAADKSDYELSQALMEKLEKIEYCKELIAGDKFVAEIVSELQEQFGLKQRQAYKIYRETEIVYPPRDIKIESLFVEIRRTKELAILQQDPRAAAASDRNYAQAIEKFYGDKEENVYRELQPVAVEIGEFPEQTVSKDFSLEELQAFADQYRQKHLNKALNQMAEDTDHEDVSNG